MMWDGYDIFFTNIFKVNNFILIELNMLNKDIGLFFDEKIFNFLNIWFDISFSINNWLKNKKMFITIKFLKGFYFLR